MANLYYRDRLIIAYASVSQTTKQWSAGAEISWKRDGRRHSHTIGALTDRFNTAEEAEKFAIHLATSWIDANPLSADKAGVRGNASRFLVKLVPPKHPCRVRANALSENF